jgi:hypothetical protein
VTLALMKLDGAELHARAVSQQPETALALAEPTGEPVERLAGQVEQQGVPLERADAPAPLRQPGLAAEIPLVAPQGPRPQALKLLEVEELPQRALLRPRGSLAALEGGSARIQQERGAAESRQQEGVAVEQ